MEKRRVVLLCFAALLILAIVGLTGCTKKTKGGNEVVIQLKWLPQAQFMGYYVAEAKGYYAEEGLKVKIVPGGGDVPETMAVHNGTANVGVTWVANLLSSQAAGLDLIEIAQIYQRSGLVLVSKKEAGLTTGASLAPPNVTVGNWGFGNEYEIKALLQKNEINKDLKSQDFTMDGFHSGEITAASAMTYNELGLVVNSYEGGLGYGDKVNIIDMNTEGVAMLEDCMFVNKTWAAANSDTLVKFLRASLKGWKAACENTDEAAAIVFKAGSSVSDAHQKHMAAEVKKLVLTDTKDNAVALTNIGRLDDAALQQTIDMTKMYAGLTDPAAAAKLKSLTLNDLRTTVYWDKAK
jgi:NitT/TauT family transport system substrate-binding protein